ncbi:tRNA uridine-5-carboxymethylaminomethyl(34) synthesis GTPase MnmE [Thermodesulfobacteriota bacterium]
MLCGRGLARPRPVDGLFTSVHQTKSSFFLDMMSDNALDKDTIAAVATPMGMAGIGIVRLSGPRSREIAEKIFVAQNPVEDFQRHRLYLGHLIDPSSEKPIDEVLLAYMKAPNSYTREDIIEINAHSGYQVLSRILQIVIDQGARLARPGEFTFRAFMNGRIDLTQAEAIVDLINAKSERGLELASHQIKGGFKKAIEALRQKAVEIISHTEVAIDFPEEETEILSREKAGNWIEKDLIGPIEKIMTAHAQRRIWIEGINTVIIGRVNAGKSSLLNRLLNEQRAIVTPVPGTTRDVIESNLNIEGIPLKLIDTAGFREVADEVEKIGLKLAEEKLNEADLILAVIDRSRPLNQDDRDIAARLRQKRSLVILNKIDLPSKLDEKELEPELLGIPIVRISALTGEGIDDLRLAIQHLVTDDGDLDTTYSQLAPNMRHQKALETGNEFFKKAAENVREGLPLEIIALDLGSGLAALGKIIGETTHEEIFDKIFSEFCLGK